MKKNILMYEERFELQKPIKFLIIRHFVLNIKIRINSIRFSKIYNARNVVKSFGVKYLVMDISTIY